MDDLKKGRALIRDEQGKIIGCLSCVDISRYQSNNKKLICHTELHENSFKISTNKTTKQALNLMTRCNVNVVYVNGDNNEI